MNIFGAFRAVVLIIATILICVGTGVEQMKNEIAGVKLKLYLYGAKAGDGDVTKYKDVGFCKDVYQRWDAAYAFAIISCIVIGFALLAVIASHFLKEQAKLLAMASAGLSVFGFVTTLISWAIVVALFHGKFCGATTSFNGAGYDLVGVALIIVTWLLMMFDVAFAALGVIKGDD